MRVASRHSSASTCRARLRATSTAPVVRLAPLHVAPITVAELDDAVTAKVISAELQEMLDREWIEQDCHVVIGESAADAYLGDRAGEGPGRRRLYLQHVGEQMTTDFPSTYVGPWDCANFVSDPPGGARVRAVRMLAPLGELALEARGRVRRRVVVGPSARPFGTITNGLRTSLIEQPPPQKRQDVRDLRGK